MKIFRVNAQNAEAEMRIRPRNYLKYFMFIIIDFSFLKRKKRLRERNIMKKVFNMFYYFYNTKPVLIIQITRSESEMQSYLLPTNVRSSYLP
jgi:hypothetical protein